MTIKKNKFFFILLFFVNLLFSAIAFYVLPEKFFYDSKIIVEDTYNEIGFFGSYAFTILFYKITFIKYLPFFLVAIIQYPIIIYVLYKIGIPKSFHILNAKNVLVYIGFFLLAIYVSMPSKEFITFLIVSLVPYIFSLKNKSDRFKIFAAFFVFILFSFFRAYYIIIPIISLGMYMLTFVKLKKKPLKVVFFGVIISILLSLFVGFFTGDYITKSTRENVNEMRIELNVKDAKSMLVSPVEPTTWYGETVSVLYGFFEVNFPLYEGIKHILKPQVIFFVIWQFMVMYILIVRFSRCLKERDKYKYEFFSLLILFSYYITQGLFEPDLGSAIRHKIGFFPLIYYIFYHENFKKNLSKKH